jgi:hypothetical protein
MKEERNTVLGSSEHDDGSYVVKKSKKSSILAFIICILVAFIIWAYAEATEKKNEEKLISAETSTVSVEGDGSISVI